MAKDRKVEVTEESPKPDMMAITPRIGWIGDYKPIPKFQSGCKNC